MNDRRAGSRGRKVLGICVLLPTLMLAVRPGGTALGFEPEAGPTVPTALAWHPDGRLIVALREGRRLTLVEPEGWQVGEVWPLDFAPLSLAVAEDGSILVGGRDGEAVALGPEGQVLAEASIGRGPTRVVPLDAGRFAAASVWDESVRVLDLASGSLLAEHALPFAPGALLPLPDGRLLVADAFGGRLAALTPGEAGSVRFWHLDLTNLGALSFSPRQGEVLLVGVESSGSTQVTRTNLDWGLVLSSKLAAIRLDRLDPESPSGRILPRQLTLDGSGHGFADPSALAISPDGQRVLIASSGAHQVLLTDRSLGGRPAPDFSPLGDSLRLRTREVGRSPNALVLDPTGRLAITADSQSDSLTVLDAESLEIVATVALGPVDPVRTPEQRGEALFHDGRTALDRWMSCASCHPKGHTNARNFDTLSDGSYGAPKNTPSLLGVGETAPFAWTGRFRTLEDQVDQSLRTSLHGPMPSAEAVADLAAYLRTLEPPPARRTADDPAVARGAKVFTARRCDACHIAPTFTSRPLRDPWPEGRGEPVRYSPPSLRGVARTAPYFHDGRVATLTEALAIHHPEWDEPPDPKQLADLAAYLESL